MNNDKCGCGCGQTVKPGNRFIHGHNRRSEYVLNHCQEEYKQIGKKIKDLHAKGDDGPFGKEYKKKQSETTKESIRIAKETGHIQEWIKNISKSMKGNKNGTFISDESKLKRNFKTQYHVKNYQEKYPIFSKEEEIRDRSVFVTGEAGIEVRCKLCKNWFVPTKGQIDSRIRAAEFGTNGGGCYFYCSEECKLKCSSYNTHVLSMIKTDGNKPKDYELRIFREEVLKRADYKCEYCGEEAVIAHHSRPVKLEPFFALDPDYGIAVCAECNIKYAHKDECSAWNIANTICT